METIELKNIKDADPKVYEVYKKLKVFKEAPARRKWDKMRSACWKGAIENEMWSAAEEEAMREVGQEPFVINKCNKGVQGSSAIVTDSKPEVKFHPVGSGDLYVAELMKRGFDHVWAKNEGNDVVYEMVEESKIGGVGFIDVKHNAAKGVFGRIEFEESPPDDIYYDPESRKRDYSDTDIIKAKLRTKEYIKERYDDLKDEDLTFQADLKKDSDNQVSSGVTGADNYTIENEKSDFPGAEKEPKCVWEIEAWLIKNVKEYRLVTFNPDGSVANQEKHDTKPTDIPEGATVLPLTVEKRVQRIIVGKKLISEKENPYGVDADGDPVIPTIGLKHQRTRTAYPMSPTAYALPINKEKSKRRMQFIAAASQDINATIVEPADQVEWIGRPGNPGSRVKVSKNAAFQPTRMISGQMNMQGFIILEDRADNDIDDQYDLHDVMRGKPPKGGEDASGRVVLALQDLGGMMSKPFLRALESTMVRVGKVICVLMLDTWPRAMWERLLEQDDWMKWTPDGQQEEADPSIQQKWIQALEKIRPSDPNAESNLSLLDFDIRMTAGSSMPTNRIAKMQMAIEMTTAGIYDTEAALEYVDDPNKDKIVKRMKENEAAMMEAEAMKGR